MQYSPAEDTEAKDPTPEKVGRPVCLSLKEPDKCTGNGVPQVSNQVGATHRWGGRLFQDLGISPVARSPGEANTIGTALEAREGDAHAKGARNARTPRRQGKERSGARDVGAFEEVTPRKGPNPPGERGPHQGPEGTGFRERRKVLVRACWRH